MTNYIKEFNGQIEDFLEYIVLICPKDEKSIKSKMSKYKTLFSTTKKINKTLVIDNFILNLLCYEEQINSRDEKFFLNLNIDDNIKDNDKLVVQLTQLKTIWHKIDDDNRNKVFDYLIVITYWARQYFNEKFKKK
jgi:hypothetical protein